MENKEKAITWWNELDYDTKYNFFCDYCNRFTRNLENIYDSEIYEIWTKNIKDKISSNELYIFSVETTNRFIVVATNTEELNENHKSYINENYGEILEIFNGSIGAINKIIYLH